MPNLLQSPTPHDQYFMDMDLDGKNLKLINACSSGDLDKVENLLNHNINPDFVTYVNDTCMREYGKYTGAYTPTVDAIEGRPPYSNYRIVIKKKGYSLRRSLIVRCG